MAHVGFEQAVREHNVKETCANEDAAPEKNSNDALQIVPDDFDRLVLKERGKLGEDLAFSFFLWREFHEPGFVRFQAKSETSEAGLFRIRMRTFGRDGEAFFSFEGLDQFGALAWR